eukprot:gnl/Dysnectes_brevis/1795_a2057_2270.p1 GENE.gnl/Dysnectes_brevis/1795_a2057_2270~~gnl/Dysnectes_brevis/1795_a2057_2270.p1  ORF type:complete len:162 (+),score=17.34 gnl/Dysnectes_brevis/1795_a2057_2270:668-1153(+)
MGDDTCPDLLDGEDVKLSSQHFDYTTCGPLCDRSRALGFKSCCCHGQIPTLNAWASRYFRREKYLAVAQSILYDIVEDDISLGKEVAFDVLSSGTTDSGSYLVSSASLFLVKKSKKLSREGKDELCEQIKAMARREGWEGRRRSARAGRPSQKACTHIRGK